jgi:branched-chain amino acid transport system permease protein
MVRIDGMPLMLAMLLGGLSAAAFGMLFGIPSLRIKGLYLAVATLAAQFFTRLGLPAHRLVHQQLVVGFGVGGPLEHVRLPIESPVRSTCSVASWWCSRDRQEPGAQPPSAGSGWRSATWTWPPAVIGIRPMYAKLRRSR